MSAPSPAPAPPSASVPAAPAPEAQAVRSPLLRDVVLGVAVGALVAMSPWTPRSLVPALASGAAVGAAFVGCRVWQRRRGPPVAAPAAERARVEVPALAWLALAAVALAFAPTAVWLYRNWTENVWDNAHGILIPVIMGYLAVATLRRDEIADAESSGWGFAFVAPGLALAAVDAALRTHYLAALGLVLTLPGLSLLFLGARRTRLLTLPLVLALFMIPVPNTLAAHFFLKKATAVAVAPLLSFVGIPVLRENTTLILPNASFLVADACSGFSALYAAVGISIVLAATARSHVRKVLLLLAAWPLAVVCNVTRVAILVGVANHYGLGLLDTPFHAASGVATFWAVLLLLFLLADRKGLRESYA